jgi:hypothetical protein
MSESQQPFEDDFVEFYRAGDPVKGEFQCVACGRAAVHRGLLSRCPGCGNALWEQGSRTPFADVYGGLRSRLILVTGEVPPRFDTPRTQVFATSRSERGRSPGR